MPKQLYDKEDILDKCLTVFARNGYENTSTTMLAEAAGISRSLIFHHFNSKKELFLNLLDRCFEKGRIELEIDSLLDADDFFEAREKLSITKFKYFKEKPDLYKFIMGVFYDTPVELETEIKEKYGDLIAGREKMIRQLFEKVPLKEGVDRDQAFELVSLTMDHFDNKYFADLSDEKILNGEYLNCFLEERNSFLSMIRNGIEKR
ncbi:MAG: TetR/AcrR family transcriptional regulator [Firmicutes bacterium]|nr:TetR/AcrR family transcriptional regulator [Bacillota bacterium]